MPNFIDEPVSVRIDRIREIDNLDIGSSAEFRAFVSIDEKQIRGSRHNGDNVSPNELFTNSNGRSNGLVPIKIELFEEDPGDDTRVDINPIGGSAKDLNLFLNLSTGEVLNADDGFRVLGRTGESITLRGFGGGRENGEITFRVFGSAGSEAENSIFIQNPFVQESPENNDRMGFQFTGNNSSMVTGDFNADGRDDLVVGTTEGKAHVVLGSSSGLSKLGNRTFSSSNTGVNISGQGFAVGDINGDNVDDLVMGSIDGSGQSVIRFGQAGSGLNSQNTIIRAPEFTNGFLSAVLATGDFNGDGFDDVASGDPLANVGNPSFTNDGAVQINYGSSSGVRNDSSRQVFHRDTPSVLGTYIHSNTQFGHALGAGDVNGDGFDDLVIGALNAPDSSSSSAGAFHVLYGTRFGLSAVNDSLTGQSFSGVVDGDSDNFGRAIAVGDITGDGIDDVVVSAPGHNNDRGSVYVYHGQANQALRGSASQILNISSFGGIPQGSRRRFRRGRPGNTGDRFGESLALKDINNDGFADLVISAPTRDVGDEQDVGTVHVAFGTRNGLTTSNQLFFRQGNRIAGEEDPFDRFGRAVAIGNFDGSGSQEVAVAAPFEDFGNVTDAGLVNIVPTPDSIQVNSNLTASTLGLDEIQSIRNGSNLADHLVGTHVNGLINGKGGADNILARGGNDIAFGAQGRDTLRGGSGDDTLIGGAGDDFIVGGTGNDLLDGGTGSDRYRGGTGQDIFGIQAGPGRDRILDFEDGIDRIGLNHGLQFQDLEIVQQGQHAIIKLGEDQLALVRGVSASQLSQLDFVALEQTLFKGIEVPVVVPSISGAPSIL